MKIWIRLLSVKARTHFKCQFTETRHKRRNLWPSRWEPMSVRYQRRKPRFSRVAQLSNLNHYKRGFDCDGRWCWEWRWRSLDKGLNLDLLLTNIDSKDLEYSEKIKLMWFVNLCCVLVCLIYIVSRCIGENSFCVHSKQTKYYKMVKQLQKCYLF